MADLRRVKQPEGWDKTAQYRVLTGRPWRRLRDSILKRDKYLCQCEQCKAQGRYTEAHEVDHIIPLSQGGDDHPNNLRAINRDCHKLKTQRESQQGKS